MSENRNQRPEAWKRFGAKQGGIIELAMLSPTVANSSESSAESSGNRERPACRLEMWWEHQLAFTPYSSVLVYPTNPGWVYPNASSTVVWPTSEKAGLSLEKQQGIGQWEMLVGPSQRRGRFWRWSPAFVSLGCLSTPLFLPLIYFKQFSLQTFLSFPVGLDICSLL